MQKFFLTISLILLTSGASFSQSNKSIIQSIPDVPTPKPGDNKISFPVSPAGYHLALKGSDHNPVIDSTGRIVPPLVATKVNLYFQLINNTTDSIRYDVSKQVIVS